ncbi:O-antigen ligase family protein [Rhodovulum sulfidophilum]|uniref:O-antigen ligase family protein n=1 Tax=Rhodovulum sulfidophilum TaxID=35806 RepID=UPI000951D946|nr:O-antigen ligase family protein [Rhodovulum sulfidophilum]OLS52116.1 hypothetical protein BV392_08985 [Rhodovulum sulfidophilum]
MVFIVGLSLTGLVSYAQLTNVYYRQNLLPVNALFDLFIVLYVFIVPATRISPIALFFLVVSTVYILMSVMFLPEPIGGAPTPVDIILSFKPFIYLIILCFSRPRGASVSLDTLEKMFKYLLLAFLVKYLVAKEVMGIPRPGLFTENNFELPFLLVLFIFLSRRGRLRSQLWVLLLFAVILVSGSRSGFLGLVAALITSARQGSTRLIMALFVAPMLLLSVLVFMDTRIGDLGDLGRIDRLIFMTRFLEELERFDLWNYAVGWGPMTPLSNITCERLAFYDSLFSAGNPNVCYPVVLHVFYFRMILDHGILGLIFLIAGFYMTMRSSGLSRSLAFAILIQGIINGLSVSGLGNTYFFLALVLVTSNYAGPRPAPLEDTR